MFRVSISGAHSVGKSTLAKKMTDYYAQSHNVYEITEVARHLIQSGFKMSQDITEYGIINYLNEYPLFGSKYLDYNNWKEVLHLFNPRFKYSQENIDKVLKLKSEMNDRRTCFIWNHLNNFYNFYFLILEND